MSLVYWSNDPPPARANLFPISHGGKSGGVSGGRRSFANTGSGTALAVGEMDRGPAVCAICGGFCEPSPGAVASPHAGGLEHGAVEQTPDPTTGLRLKWGEGADEKRFARTGGGAGRWCPFCT